MSHTPTITAGQWLSQLRQQSPLVHNITNYVVMNNTANALLALGASPVMAHAHPELADMVGIAGATVINIGTLDEYWSASYLQAAQAAQRLGKPWLLDPVGAGATPYRNQMLTELLLQRPAVIRGNASEVMALAQQAAQIKGVDSTHQSEEALDAAKRLSHTTGAVVCISGATDYVVDQDKVTTIGGGHPLMTKVTGMGCTASALIGAFLAAGAPAFEATCTAMLVMAHCGAAAARLAQGPGTLQLHFLDALHQLQPQDLEAYA
jgi:hydroxyethylthiazole kinase